MLDLMERELGIERGYAIALGSIAVDLRVTQIVNGSRVCTPSFETTR